MAILKSNEPKKFNGIWFVPHMEIELPGVLTIDKFNYNQSLKLYSKVDFSGISFTSGEVEPREYSTICGNCGLNIKITLNDCTFRGATHIGTDIYEITYEPRFSFVNGIFFEHEKTKIIQLTCTFPYFSSWFDTNRSYFGSLNSSCNFLEKMKPALSHEELFDEIKINDDFSIIIEREYQQVVWPLIKEVKAEIKHYIHFRSSSYKSLKEFKKLAYQFMQLIKLSTGKLMYIDYVSVLVKQEDLNDFSEKIITKDGSVFISIFNYNNLHKRNLIKSDYIHQNNMLFYGGQNRTDKLKQTIIRWYNTIEEYSPVYNIFLDTFEWFQNTDALLSQIMFNNRVLNLVQALESYHKFSYHDMNDENKEDVEAKAKDILKAITKPKDYQWLIKRIMPQHVTLKERLRDLLHEKLQVITSELFQKNRKIKGYIEKIKNIRNELSHGEKDKLDGIEITDYYYKTLIILLSCILVNLGFSQNEIKNTLFRTLTYRNMISYIKSNM